MDKLQSKGIFIYQTSQKSEINASIHYVVKSLTAKSGEVSKPRDWML